MCEAYAWHDCRTNFNAHSLLPLCLCLCSFLQFMQAVLICILVFFRCFSFVLNVKCFTHLKDSKKH